MKTYKEDVRGTANAHNLTEAEHRELALLYRAFVNIDTAYNTPKFKKNVISSLVPHAKRIANSKTKRVNKSLQRKRVIENIIRVFRVYNMNSREYAYLVNRDCVDFLRLKTLTENQELHIEEGRNSIFRNMNAREILCCLYLARAGEAVLKREDYCMEGVILKMTTQEAKKCLHTSRNDIMSTLSTICEKIAAEALSVRKFATPLYKTFIKSLNLFDWCDLDLTRDLIEVTREKRGVLTINLNPLLIYWLLPTKSKQSMLKIDITTPPEELRSAIEEGQGK